MKPACVPNVPGDTEAERFDNAVRKIFSVSAVRFGIVGSPFPSTFASAAALSTVSQGCLTAATDSLTSLPARQTRCQSRPVLARKAI